MNEIKFRLKRITIMNIILLLVMIPIFYPEVLFDETGDEQIDSYVDGLRSVIIWIYYVGMGVQLGMINRGIREP